MLNRLLLAGLVLNVFTGVSLANDGLPVWSPGMDADTHWNVKVPDPYRALENVADPKVQQWLRAHAEATAARLAKIPARDALLTRIRELDAASPGLVSRIERTPSGRVFFLRRDPSDNQFKLVLA